MSQPKYKALLEKSVHAAISSIEIYNKPDFKYREETFSILLVNAWELMLKARIIKHHKSLNCIYEYETSTITASGKKKKPVLKKNKSGNPRSISLTRCLEKCTTINEISFESACCDNIQSMIEVRDSAIHFSSFDKYLCKKVHEIGTASLKNYVLLVKEWFNYDLSKYNFYLMPLSFFHEFETMESFSLSPKNKQIKNLLDFISNKELHNASESESNYFVSMKVKTDLYRSKNTDDLHIGVTSNINDPNAAKILITEEDVLKKYPFDHNALKQKLRDKYVDFKEGKKFNNLMKELKKETKYTFHRPNNALKPNGSTTALYSPEVFKVFNNHYTKK